jgi:hypothetical protein
MAPPTSHEELEELSPSRILEYLEKHHPGSPLEISHQDRVFLAENPTCLAVEQGKRGGDGGNIKTNQPLPRNGDSSTISYFKPAVKPSEGIQPSVTQTGARTYIPCTADLRIENDNYHLIHVRSPANSTNELSSLVNRQGVTAPTGSTCSNEQEEVSPPPPTRDLIGQGCVDTVIHDQLALALDDAQAQLKNHKVCCLAPVYKLTHTVDVSLAVERGGSGVTATTNENQDVASLDDPKTMNDEHTCRSRPVKDTMHQEDAPYVEERKGLLIGRGIVKKISIKDDERQETFAGTIAGAFLAPALHIERTKHLIIGRGIVGEIATKQNEHLGTSVPATDGANAAPVSAIKRDEHQETLTQVVVCENDALVSYGKRNECPEVSIQSAAGARSPSAFYVEQMKNLVIGQGVGRNGGVKGNEHQQTFARGVASADCMPAPGCPLPESDNVEETRQLVVGRASVKRPASGRTNFKWHSSEL